MRWIFYSMDKGLLEESLFGKLGIDTQLGFQDFMIWIMRELAVCRGIRSAISLLLALLTRKKMGDLRLLLKIPRLNKFGKQIMPLNLFRLKKIKNSDWAIVLELETGIDQSKIFAAVYVTKYLDLRSSWPSGSLKNQTSLLWRQTARYSKWQKKGSCCIKSDSKFLVLASDIA